VASSAASSSVKTSSSAAYTAATSTSAYVASTTSSAASSTSTGSFTYTFYKGNGTVAAGWPAQSSWLDFDTLWNYNVPIMQQSCVNDGWSTENDSDQEVADMKTAIQAVASDSGVDERFILAIIMQESNGCVRVVCIPDSFHQ